MLTELFAKDKHGHYVTETVSAPVIWNYLDWCTQLFIMVCHRQKVEYKILYRVLNLVGRVQRPLIADLQEYVN